MDTRVKGDNYYGSELNKLVDLECTRLMTAMNIDLIMHKKSKSMIRIIESKHSNEGMKKGQKDLLELLGKRAEFIGAAIGVKFEVYIVYGDPPYNTAKIVNLQSGDETIIDKQTLISFLNFEIMFNELTQTEKAQNELPY
jgi:16S rRNA G966 N2-methylase RsmD